MKDFQIILFKYNKTKLMNILLVYNIKVFGMYNHILLVDDKPKGINIKKNAPIPKLETVIKQLPVQKQMKASQAHLLTFSEADFRLFKHSFNSMYNLTKEDKKSLHYKSNTQKAHFIIHCNGHIETSKDLLDMDLIYNIYRVLNHKKPLDPTTTI